MGHKLVRGGPWCRKKLSDMDLLELRDCKGKASLGALRAVAAKYPGGSLGSHLEGRAFRPAAPRCAKVTEKKNRSGPSGTSSPGTRSGVSGSQYRKQAGLSYGTQRYEQLKFGRHPERARARHLTAHRARKKLALPVRARAPPSHIAQKRLAHERPVHCLRAGFSLDASCSFASQNPRTAEV
jgi:hypothetical protein